MRRQEHRPISSEPKKPKKKHRFVKVILLLLVIGAAFLLYTHPYILDELVSLVVPRPVIYIVSDPANGGLDDYYTQMVYNAGGDVAMISTDESRDEMAFNLDHADAFIFTGGEDVDPALYGEKATTDTLLINRARDDFELALIEGADERDIPVLGICRGMQLINVHRDGTLIQDIPSALPDAVVHRDPLMQSFAFHSLTFESDSHLADLLHHPETVEVNSWHHQAVDQLGEGLVAAGHAEDGIVEAIEDPSKPFFIGVEFHPERLPLESEVSLPLFRALVNAARK